MSVDRTTANETMLLHSVSPTTSQSSRNTSLHAVTRSVFDSGTDAGMPRTQFCNDDPGVPSPGSTEHSRYIKRDDRKFAAECAER